MVLKDLGHLDFEEPYTRFRAHGTIVKDGAKMSKSRGNVVIPDDFVARWGADTFRMYMMFLGPYQVGGDFRDEGITGISRFLDKLWGAVAAVDRRKSAADFPNTRRKVHQTIRNITADMVELRYNTAIAALMECLNELRAECGEGGVALELLEPVVILLAPLAPHYAEECWERLGHKTSVFDAQWPGFDEALAREDEVELVIQVNGKVRGRIRVARGMSQDEAVKLALADDGVKRFVDGKPVRKVIYVEDKLVNLVV